MVWRRIRFMVLVVLALCVAGMPALAQTNLGPIKTTYQDEIGAASSPGLPSSGICRHYFNTTTGLETWLNSTGAICGPTAGATSGPQIGVNAVNQSTTLQATGAFGSSTVNPTGNTTGTLSPTATSQAPLSVGQSAGASTSTVIGMSFGENGSTSLIGMEAFNQWSFEAALGGTTNDRFWFGLGCHTSGGTGNNGAVIVGTTAYATDTPNKSTVGFTYSAGVASGHFQAAVITAGSSVGAMTEVDTGVVADTATHVFQMTTDVAGATIFFFIDFGLVATITTNLPPPANNGNSWGDLFFTGDNKNTATAISLKFYSMQISFK